ncbi:Uncharacterized protein GBIM_06093 [Gryllus bimaculatus]|nr:Uncharacterized protein GBIM_06093 [Gryllus bimaculatus]
MKDEPSAATMALRRHVTASAAAAAATALLLLLLLLAPADAAAGATPIHKHMSPAELRHVFQVDSHDLVPQYEVVRLRSSPGAGGAEGAEGAAAGAGGRARHGIDNTNFITTNTNKQNRQREEEEIGQAFQDEQTLAALLLRKDARDGKLLMEGTIGHDLVLKPVPARVRQHLDDAAEDADADAEESAEDDEAWLDEAGEDPRDDVAVGGGFPLGRARRAAPEPTHPHIVFRRSASAAGPPSDYGEHCAPPTNFDNLIYFLLKSIKTVCGLRQSLTDPLLSFSISILFPRTNLTLLNVLL